MSPLKKAFPSTVTMAANLEFPVAVKVPPTETLLATSRRPLTETALLNSALDSKVPAPTNRKVPPMETFSRTSRPPLTETSDLNVAAPTAVTVLCNCVAPDTVTVEPN